MSAVFDDMEPETAKKLVSLAQTRGVTVVELLRLYVPGLANNGATDKAAGQLDKLAEFRAWVKRHSTTGANLSEEAISRHSIYPDR